MLSKLILLMMVILIVRNDFPLQGYMQCRGNRELFHETLFIRKTYNFSPKFQFLYYLKC